MKGSGTLLVHAYQCVSGHEQQITESTASHVIINTTNYAVVASHLYMAVAVNAELLAWVSWGVCSTHAMYVSHDPVPSGTYIGCTKDRELMALLLWLVQYPSPQLRYTSLHVVCWLNMYIKY